MTTPAVADPRGGDSSGLSPTTRRVLGFLGLLAPAVLLYVTFFAWPLVGLFLDSLEGDSYRRVLDNPLVRRSSINTLWITGLSTLTTVTIGYFLAYVIWRQGPFMRVVLFSLVLLPFWTGVLVKNFAWAVLLQDNGLVNGTLQKVGVVDSPLELLHTRIAVIVAMTHFLLPFAVFPIYAALSALDKGLEQAAASLGAGRMSIFLRVTLPLSLPGVSAAGLLVAILCTGFFVTPVVLGGPGDMMVANQIEFYARRLTDFSAASALAVMLTVFVSVLALLYQRALRSGGQHG
jgi:ABC-type spermidine/putrescine transport system permease subunit I